MVDHVVESEAPMVAKLLKTERIALAIAALFTLLGAAGGAIGYNVSGPKDAIKQVAARVDTNSAHIREMEHGDRSQRDSLYRLLEALSSKIHTLELTNCQLMRKLAPELRPPDTCP